MDYVAIAIPVFLVLIMLELAVSRRRKVRVYRFADAISDLSNGVGNRVIDALAHALLAGVYHYVHSNWTLVKFPGGHWAPWVIALVGLDFLYYWWHRASHVINCLWASHIVHHQSEDYNLAVALRQEWIGLFTGFVFYLPLAFLGIPVEAFIFSGAVSLLYQFWIHTQLVPKLGFLEEFLNTPSHHRVHHAINPQYLDKNFGAILIIWDRMFGTFEREQEKPAYGITSPLNNFNPLWANLHYWVEIFRLSAAASRWSEKIFAFAAHPRWRPSNLPPGAPPKAVFADQVVKYDPQAPRKTRAWVLFQFVLTAGVMTWMLFARDGLPAWLIVVVSVWIFAGLASMSGLLERKNWAPPVEWARAIAMAAVAPMVMQ
ncbi:MAG: hypothetical protein GMKNLPBB_02768 [Myxococcota bacterium]|nr:hypothetical protein [Myxococcota bacterium]